MGSGPSKQEEPTLLAKAAQEQGDKLPARATPNLPSINDADTATQMTDSSSPQEDRKIRSKSGKSPISEASSSKLPNGHSNKWDDAQSTVISDDQVHVNLAMADLMAYLQVVANNSQNLPMTRRDDPEISKSVSSLTADEYAKKSAAFIPADVRVIGGSFTKYGRVWDLPTSEEYNASDGAQEPGRSFGGACCNSMLKVLYDAANEAADEANRTAAADALFDDDDDDESLFKPTEIERKRTFESLVLGDVSTPSTITWAELLRKMKAEVHDIEYAQAPTITSNRKFDLNKPFSLIPENFDPEKGKKRSLLIGCNYNSVHGAELSACHDDIRSMKDYIVNVHGFPESDDLMTVLLDDDQHKHPTHQNITDAFKALSEQSQPGDALFVQFSGHGGRILDSPIDDEAESYDEVIAPCDYATSGLIRDTLIFKTLFAPMRYGVTLTLLIDCCDTGMMLELPYAWTTKGDRPGVVAKMVPDDDFSFMRFLKVVKTLYESSVFTQLGKTVGSALDAPLLEDIQESASAADGEEETVNYDTLVTADEATVSTERPKTSLLSALTSCTSPNQARLELQDAKAKGFQKRDDSATLDTAESRVVTASLLDSVMNSCNIGHHGDESDEETYGETATFDSGTEDGYDSYRERMRARRGVV